MIPKRTVIYIICTLIQIHFVYSKINNERFKSNYMMAMKYIHTYANI